MCSASCDSRRQWGYSVVGSSIWTVCVCLPIYCLLHGWVSEWMAVRHRMSVCLYVCVCLCVCVWQSLQQAPRYGSVSNGAV